MSNLGVIQYCNDYGSGFITNPALPWLSTYNVEQLNQVYDQTPGWLRDNPAGGRFSYFPVFGDGGGFPGGGPGPQPADLSCGMGAVDPGQYEARYGKPEPDYATCLKIQCGAIPQSQAGLQLIEDCANAGYTGVKTCLDPACGPYIDMMPGCQPWPAPSQPKNLVLLRSDVVAPMPSITATARTGCQTVPSCPSGIASWVDQNPWLAIGLAFVVGYVLTGGKR